MKVTKKTKNIILVVLLLVIIGMAIGYAALSQTLTINGTANIKSTWDVEITGITAASTNAANGATNTNDVAPTFDATTATFAVDLAYPGATATYTVTVENKGSIDAKLQSVTDLSTINSSDPEDISFSITAAANDTLDASATKTYDVTVTWDADSQSIPTTKSKTATIELNYVQAD